jgi:hypothetical protein
MGIGAMTEDDLDLSDSSQKANRCFLSIREFATMKVECESNCLDCGYFARYFPEEKMAMDGLCSHTVSKSKMNT